VARRSAKGHGTSSGWLGIRGWRSILFDGHAELVEGAGVFGVFGRDAFLDWLGALELRTGIEEAALFAAMQFGLALGTCAVGIESRSEDGAAIGTSRARNGTNHARRAWAELISAAGPAGRGLAVMGFVFCLVFFRVAVTAVAVLSIHKRLRPPVSTDCYNYNSCSGAVALGSLAYIQSDCYTRPDSRNHSLGLLAEMRTSGEQEMGHLCL
jgi:hypothetical protein